jgi:hypothetical protein
MTRCGGRDKGATRAGPGRDRYGKTALIVPLLLSYGGIEDGMKERLKGLSYTMALQGLLPHGRIAHWVLEVGRQ